MRLAEWRRAQDWTQEQLAARLGCNQSFISYIERSDNPQIPGRDFMLRIYRLTWGAVTPNDFYDLPALEQLSLPMQDPPVVAPAPLLEPAVDDGEERQRQLQDIAA